MVKELRCFFMLVVFAITLTTCKKYPEGGKHSGAKKDIAGTWDMKQIFVNGNDSTNVYSNYLCQYTFEVYLIGGKTYYSKTCSGICGTWDLKKYKNVLYMDTEGKGPCSGGFLGGNSSKTGKEWVILKLTNEMKLKNISSNGADEYIVVLNKIN